MLKHAAKISRAFDQAAPTYDEYSELQQHAGRNLISLILPGEYNQIIDLGCGTGAITSHLVDIFKPEQLHAIDTSIMSLAIAHERLNKSSVIIQNMNFDVSLPDCGLFDLVFANMSLHWSLNLSHLLHRIDKCLAKNGIIAFSIPLNNTFIELVSRFSVNHFLTIDALYALFDTLNVSIIQSQQETVTMRFPDTLSTLRYIKRIGAHHVTATRHSGLIGKNAIAAMDIQSLTYQLGYFIASKNE